MTFFAWNIRLCGFRGSVWFRLLFNAQVQMMWYDAMGFTCYPSILLISGFDCRSFECDNGNKTTWHFQIIVVVAMQLKPMPFDFVVLCICLHIQAPRVIELDEIESEREWKSGRVLDLEVLIIIIVLVIYVYVGVFGL